jgi:kynurenine formamidase
MTDEVLQQLAQQIACNSIRVVDLTHTLDPDFPVMILPPEFGQCARFRMEEISAYDHRGPAWKWHNLTLSEHTGTHFDAPSHWVSGKDLPENSVDEIPVNNFIGPVIVIDCSSGAAENSDFELTPDLILDWESTHGTVPEDTWVLMRTDWSKKTGADYLNMRDDGPHSPGPTPEAIRFLIEQRNIRGFGTETVGALHSTLSCPLLFARGWKIWLAMPEQSRSIAPSRGDTVRSATENPKRYRQPPARAGVGCPSICKGDEAWLK